MPSLTATTPAEPHADQKARIAAAVDAARRRDPRPVAPDPRGSRSRRSRSTTPRPGSPRCSPGTAIEVELPAGTLATAIRATRRGGRGGDGPRIGILAEYDALPGLGHGCGHNTMAASGVGAAIALASIADELPGEIVFLGTPAEERGSGKQIMIDDGLFDGLDAALLFHPCDRNHVESSAARVRGRRRRVPRPAGARVVRPVDGPATRSTR